MVIYMFQNMVQILTMRSIVYKQEETMDGPTLQVTGTIKLTDTSIGRLLANNVQNSIQEM